MTDFFIYFAMRLCRRRCVVKNSCSVNYLCITHDIRIVKTRTNKHKQTDVILYVNGGCGLNNSYLIKCSQQEMYCVSRAKICTLGGVDKIGIGPEWTTEKKSFKEKKIQKIKSFI